MCACICVNMFVCLCNYVCTCICVLPLLSTHRWYMDVLGKACRDKEESCGDGKLNFAEINDILTIANQVAEHSRQGEIIVYTFSLGDMHPLDYVLTTNYEILERFMWYISLSSSLSILWHLLISVNLISLCCRICSSKILQHAAQAYDFVANCVGVFVCSCGVCAHSNFKKISSL